MTDLEFVQKHYQDYNNAVQLCRSKCLSPVVRKSCLKDLCVVYYLTRRIFDLDIVSGGVDVLRTFESVFKSLNVDFRLFLKEIDGVSIISVVDAVKAGKDMDYAILCILYTAYTMCRMTDCDDFIAVSDALGSISLDAIYLDSFKYKRQPLPRGVFLWRLFVSIMTGLFVLWCFMKGGWF